MKFDAKLQIKFFAKKKRLDQKYKHCQTFSYRKVYTCDLLLFFLFQKKKKKLPAQRRGVFSERKNNVDESELTPSIDSRILKRNKNQFKLFFFQFIFGTLLFMPNIILKKNCCLFFCCL